MIIRHVTAVGEASGEPTGYSASFLRGKRDWFSQFNFGRATRYEGWFLTNEQDEPHQFWKFLERVEIFPSKPELPESIHATPGAVKHQYSNGRDVTFQLVTDLPSAGGMRITCSKPAELELNLDMRGIYLQPDEGRTYEVATERGGYMVSYTDPTLAGTTLYLCVTSGDRLNKPEITWKPVRYGRDSQRNSEPSNLHIVSLGTVETTNLYLGIGFSEEQARAGARAASSLKPASFETMPSATPHQVSLYLAETSLQYLHVSTGYYAGFPWFHQHWSRDELITGLGLPLDQQLTLISRYLNTSTYMGELPTYAGSGTYCSDGVGWLSLLIREVGISNIPEAMRGEITTFLQGAISGLNQSRKTPTGLIWSGHNTTWMDTIGRVGCRIEIQAMYGLCLQLLAELTGSQQFETDREAHLGTIRHTLFQEYLRDGLEEDLSLSNQKRPNVFLAYLIQPDLLTRDQWDATFTTVLDNCWTRWGGITSLNWQDPEFQKQSTGENNLSYHQGDSWFHINCLAAISLHRHNKELYHSVIAMLTDSACSELLWQHYLGTPGEIASAESGASWGCGIQGFAGGPLVKLLTETKNEA